MPTNAEAAEVIIKRVYRSWRFSDKKMTVARATVLALMMAGLLPNGEMSQDALDAIVDDVNVGKWER